MSIVSTHVKSRSPYRTTWVSDLLWCFSTIPVLNHVQEMVYSEYSQRSYMYLQCTCGTWLNNDCVISTCPSTTQEFNKWCSSAFGGLREFSWAAEAIYQPLQLSILSCCNLYCMWQWKIEFEYMYINSKKMYNVSLLPLWVHNIRASLMFYACFTHGEECCCTSVLHMFM